MDAKNRISSNFQDSIELTNRSTEELVPLLMAAVHIFVQALSNGYKVLTCGNGGSAADAQHFAAELMGRFERERSPVPADRKLTHFRG